MKKRTRKEARLVEFSLLHHVNISLISLSFNLPEKAIQAILKKYGIKQT